MYSENAGNSLGCPNRGTGLAQNLSHPFILVQHLTPDGCIAQQLQQLFTQRIRRQIWTQQFADGCMTLVGKPLFLRQTIYEQVYQRHIPDVPQSQFHNVVERFAALEIVADYLRAPEIGSLERCRSGGYGCRRCMTHQLVGLSEADLDILS